MSSILNFPVVAYLVQLIAFHGNQINYNVSNPVGQRWAGHLTVRFDSAPQDLFGFNPSSPASLSRSERTDLLLNGSSYSGKTTKDSQLVEGALLSPYGFTVVFYDVPLDHCLHEDCGRSILLQDADSSPLQNKLYAYPPSAPRIYRDLNYSSCDSSWGVSCFNCATYTTSLGISAIEDSGFFKTYIPALASQSTSHCRCYVSGEWVPQSFCARDFLPNCRYNDPVSVIDEGSPITDPVVSAVESAPLLVSGELH